MVATGYLANCLNFNMKKILPLLLLTLTGIWSCDEAVPATEEAGRVRFTFADSTPTNGRKKTDGAHAVLITVKDASGTVIHDRQKITLFSFNGELISEV